MDKRARVVMLPTNKKADIIKQWNNKLFVSTYKFNSSDIFQHLYITSDDEIKDGDWCININEDTIYQPNCLGNFSNWRKIIATTDSSLYYVLNHSTDTKEFNQQKSLPQPTQSFIQKYVDEYNKGNQIVDVLVEYEQYDGTTSISSDWNSKLKVNPKDNTITIRRVKDSWSKDEVINYSYWLRTTDFNVEGYSPEDCFNKWIEENL